MGKIHDQSNRFLNQDKVAISLSLKHYIWYLSTMKWDHSQVHDRDSLRLKGYDYRLPGAYFVTLGSWQRECLFGEVLEGKIRLNSLGDIVHSEWLKLTHHFPHMQLGEFIVMPNHIHGIIIIEYEAYVGATRPTESEIVDSSSSWVNQIINNRGG
jgi:hypothetical protein